MKRRAITSEPRERFVSHVVAELERAAVDYVLLHNYDEAGSKDSDLDLAVARESLSTIDALIRAGTFGRLVQCLHYDVPWCRYYVVRVEEPGRRYRAIDVACDPWGIGRYGKASSLALAHPRLLESGRVPAPEAEAAYLAVKRARKGDLRSEDQAVLIAAFKRDPSATTELLRDLAGAPGTSVADALERDGSELARALGTLDRAISRRRRSPAALGRRTGFSSLRAARRVLQPSGLVVCLVGPDGVGKSTLAQGLVENARGAFRRTVRIGQRRGYLPSPGRLLLRQPSNTTEPHAQEPSGRAGSLARIAYMWLDAAVGWLPRVGLPRVRSTLVVLERGWLDLTVDPRRYRLSAGARLTRALGPLLPQPDLVLVLDAPPSVIVERKTELQRSEVERQLEAWRALVARSRRRFQRLDASHDPEAVLAEALARIEDRLALRQRTFGSARLAQRCLGPIHAHGPAHAIVSVRDRVRWLLPTGKGAKGPRDAGVYRPTRARDVPLTLALELAHAAGAGRFGPRVGVDPGRGLAPALAAHLGRAQVRLFAAATGDERRGQRALLSVWDRDRLVAFAKVSEDPLPLERERAVLEALAASGLRATVAPKIISSFVWEGCSVLLLEPVPVRGRADRDVGPVEISALAEIGSLSGPLTALLGAERGLVPLHGDFAPWNSSTLADGRISLWDWEDVRLGLPLEDLFHWRAQRLALLGRGTSAGLVAGALEPDPKVRELCAQLGVEPDIAPAALRAVLERALAKDGTSGAQNGAAARRRALALLEGTPA